MEGFRDETDEFSTTENQSVEVSSVVSKRCGRWRIVRLLAIDWRSWEVFGFLDGSDRSGMFEPVSVVIYCGITLGTLIAIRRKGSAITSRATGNMTLRLTHPNG